MILEKSFEKFSFGLIWFWKQKKRVGFIFGVRKGRLFIFLLLSANRKKLPL